jgi:hypothetical protein
LPPSEWGGGGSRGVRGAGRSGSRGEGAGRSGSRGVRARRGSLHRVTPDGGVCSWVVICCE